MKYWSLGFLVLVGFNIFIWRQILVGQPTSLELDFLDVGQGDSELIVLPGGVRVLIDGGPDKKVLFELAKVLPPTERYLDFLVMTHPQLDHFAGFADVIERYQVGAFVATGKEGETEIWNHFLGLLDKKKIPVILIKAGDKITYRDNSLDVLSPDKELLESRELNDTSIVFKLESQGVKALFTGDAGFRVENYLSQHYDTEIDILKVGHHGSRYATGPEFLMKTTPSIAVIEVGIKNRYGHPTEITLNNLKRIGSQIYRTDKNGTVRIRIKDGLAAVFPSS